MLKKEIVFVNHSGISISEYPYPAKKNIPKWYKDQPSYIPGISPEVFSENGASTGKKCMPLFDAMTSGYIIPTFFDIEVKIENGVQIFKSNEWDVFLTTMGTGYRTTIVDSLVSSQMRSQAINHPADFGHDYPKFSNPWSIKTPKGYSCLFTNVMHRDSLFTILEGIVDTDKYIHPVFFPFVMKDKTWEGIIPAGTPICQVVPFKRDLWKMKLIENIDNDYKTAYVDKIAKMVGHGIDIYKKNWWTRKHFD